MVKEHLCTVAVDVAMSEEHADGESRLNVIGQIQEGLVGIPSMSILQLVFLFGLLWLVMCSYNPPPLPFHSRRSFKRSSSPGVGSLKACQREDKDLYSSKFFENTDLCKGLV